MTSTRVSTSRATMHDCPISRVLHSHSFVQIPDLQTRSSSYLAFVCSPMVRVHTAGEKVLWPWRRGEIRTSLSTGSSLDQEMPPFFHGTIPYFCHIAPYKDQKSRSEPFRGHFRLKFVTRSKLWEQNYGILIRDLSFDPPNLVGPAQSTTVVPGMY